MESVNNKKKWESILQSAILNGDSSLLDDFKAKGVFREFNEGDITKMSIDAIKHGQDESAIYLLQHFNTPYMSKNFIIAASTDNNEKLLKSAIELAIKEKLLYKADFTFLDMGIRPKHRAILKREILKGNRPDPVIKSHMDIAL